MELHCKRLSTRCFQAPAVISCGGSNLSFVAVGGMYQEIILCDKCVLKWYRPSSSQNL